MYQNIPTKVLTGEVRLSYEHLSTPVTPQGGQEPKYSVTLLIPKTDTTTYNDIMSSMTAAYEEGVAKKWGGARPQGRQLIYDGDGVRENGLPFGDECKGHWVMTASSKHKPQVVDITNIAVELAPQDIYSGMYARVTINFFPYDTSNSRGVGCGLGNVLKLREGEPLAGGASAMSDFADIVPAAHAPSPATAPAYPATPATAPAYPATPAAAPAYPGAIDPITGQPIR